MLSIFCDIDTIYFFYDFSLYSLKSHDKLWYHNNCRCVVLKMCEACCMSSQSRYKFWVIKSVPEAKLSIQPGLMLVFLIYMKWLGVWLFPPIPEWMAGPSQDNNPAFDQASLTISLVPIYAPWWRVALWEDSFFCSRMQHIDVAMSQIWTPRLESSCQSQYSWQL